MDRCQSSSIHGQTSSSYTSRTPVSRPYTARPLSKYSESSRPGTRRRLRTAPSSIGGIEAQQIFCAVSESRGVSPTVGLAFVNLATNEVVLSQINDCQMYTRTIHKLQVFEPSELLIMSTATQSTSKMLSAVQKIFAEDQLIHLDRKYWSESAGLENIHRLAFAEDVEPIKTAIGGNYFATCCFAAVIKYIDSVHSMTFAPHSVRIKYEPSEGTMMIDLSTIRALELIQNLENSKSKDCLFGLMNHTLTPMGSRTLRSNILQPLTDTNLLELRLDALEELTSNEDVFVAVRESLKPFKDVDKLLTSLILLSPSQSIYQIEQSINNVLRLKHFVTSVQPVFDALCGVKSKLLGHIRESCNPQRILSTKQMIDDVLNEDVTYQSLPLDLKNQRTYAVKSGVNGLLDVARMTFKELTEDLFKGVTELSTQFDIPLDIKYDNGRHFFIQIPLSEVANELPSIFINVFRTKKVIQCQTLEILQQNQQIEDSHTEIVMMSDKVIGQLTEDVKTEISSLFRISDGLAMLDMLASFAQVATSQDYIRPMFGNTVAIKAGRHPIREVIGEEKFIPNDVFANFDSRFQIVTGCNMSGKSTYTRSIALWTVMAQVGCFVPATFACFPLQKQLFARVAVDDGNEANVSTFANEMREAAFILNNITENSLVVVDELGRGTSTRDGMAIAISIAEALVESRAFVWFTTHFHELSHVLAERSGVINLHLETTDKMTMLYKVANGCMEEDHYGLTLAQVMTLPAQVLDVATDVSESLTRATKRKKMNTNVSTILKRRRLVLALKQQLVQANEGALQGKALADWLRKLQAEFVLRMSELDASENEEMETGTVD